MLYHIQVYFRELFQILHFRQHFLEQEICLGLRWQVHLEAAGKVQIKEKYCAVHDSNPSPVLREKSINTLDSLAGEDGQSPPFLH